MYFSYQQDLYAGHMCLDYQCQNMRAKHPIMKYESELNLVHISTLSLLLQNEVNSKLQRLFPGGLVTQLSVVRDESEIVTLIKQYNKIQLRLEVLLDRYSFLLESGKTVSRNKVELVCTLMSVLGLGICADPGCTKVWTKMHLD